MDTETPQENLLEQQPHKDEVTIPEKFLDKETGEVRLDVLIKSYISLEQKLSKLSSTQSAKTLPQTAEEYDVTLVSDMLEIDPSVNARLYAKGFTNEQVQEVYDLAADKLVPMIAEMMHDMQADRELERIVEKFGGAEKWMKISHQLLNFGQKNLDTKTLNTLASSYDGVIRLYDMMMSSRQSKGFDRKGGASGISLDEKSLAKMMRDPRYWKEKDPNFIAKVTEGFQDIYS